MSPAEPFNPVVLAPTYNNARTLPDVVARVMALGLPMIVVNDGSTDATAEVLRSFLVARRLTSRSPFAGDGQEKARATRPLGPSPLPSPPSTGEREDVARTLVGGLPC
jgi:cellulose synthase/poly-beta-1,6-N-acetylglucosamine synthase-like glycosyltransferase